MNTGGIQKMHTLIKDDNFFNDLQEELFINAEAWKNSFIRMNNL
jgi:hypothetical protein